MGDFEPRGHLERIASEKLRDRGWEVRGERRSGVDLDLAVAFGGTPGLIRFRNAFEVAARHAESSESSPTHVRVDLGEPAGEPSRWALWDRYEFPGGKNTPRYDAVVIHEALGETWASVAGCSVAPKMTWYSAHKTIEMVLARAEALGPGRDEGSRRAAIFDAHRHNFGVQDQRGKTIVTIVVLSLLAAALGAVAAEAASGAPDDARQLLALLVPGLPALVFALIAVIELVRLLRAPRTPLGEMAAVEEMLRGSGTFTTFAKTPRKDRDGLPVVVRTGEYLMDAAAPLSLCRLSARSSSHEVALDADLCRVTWPEGLLPDQRFLPDRWLTVDLSGSEADLAKLPEGPREDRAAGVVRWSWTGEDLDAGDAAEHFQKVAEALGAGGSPYR